MSQRTERVAALLLQEVSQIIREDLQNPRIGFLTLLRAEITPDLRLAKVFYSIMGTDAEKKASDIELRNSSKYIKKHVNQRISLRYAIEIRFIREDAIDKSFRIESILQQIRKEREQSQNSGDESQRPE